MRLIHSLSHTGLIFGALFFAASITPSLVPRAYVEQGILSGFCFAVGYSVGVFLRWLWAYLELPIPRSTRKKPIKFALAAICALAVVSSVWFARPWLDSVRLAMNMPPVDDIYLVRTLLIALATFAVLMVIGRVFMWLSVGVARRARSWMPRRVANVIGAACAALLFLFVANGVIVKGALRVVDASFRQADALIPPDSTAPTLPSVTGSTLSLVDWDKLGRAGRDFVVSAPDAARISSFTGRAARTPIRVYVGLPAGDSARERAHLALKELLRVGGFSRKALVIITPTGTGWVDPGAILSLEYLYRGDVASVAMQYSYLPSPLSLLVEPGYGQDASRALFDEVYGYWKTLPKADRPKLYLHGLSLGAMNSERAVDAFEMLGDPINGAMWSGPPFSSTHWRALTDGRNAGSPAWLPEFRDGSLVRFMNQNGTRVPADAPWGPMRLVYLQYASDAVTFFDPHDAWRAPDWMYEPRGPDVSPSLRWYPLVSMFQLALDMLLADGAPMGYGHVFAPSHYIDAWLLVTGIADWPPADLARLKQMLDQQRLQAIQALRD
ncbi:alpha/beta hydrolase [Uliginosibacterium sp. sgz301328]|uniref:alpha/beta hydrolase n=1 Tax=Uliginosibacterium sp. sgz301328 TaxID=3243764 RepID=UPI00359D1EE1